MSRHRPGAPEEGPRQPQVHDPEPRTRTEAIVPEIGQGPVIVQSALLGLVSPHLPIGRLCGHPELVRFLLAQLRPQGEPALFRRLQARYSTPLRIEMVVQEGLEVTWDDGVAAQISEALQSLRDASAPESWVPPTGRLSFDVDSVDPRWVNREGYPPPEERHQPGDTVEVRLDLVSFPADEFRKHFRQFATSFSERVEAERAENLAWIQDELRLYEGRNFGSVEANKAVVDQINAELRRAGLCLRCHRCGQPALLSFNARASSTGQIQMGHSEGNHGGGSVMPPLVVIAGPDSAPPFP